MTQGAAMTRATLLLSAACVVCLIGCNAIVGSLAPDRSAAAIVINGLRDTMYVGDSVPVGADVNSRRHGRPASTDTLVAWSSSNPAAIAAEMPRPAPFPTRNFAWLIAKGSGQATITAQAGTITASKVVTVLGPNDIAAGDQRLGYALADQPNAAGPYAPSAATRFNSSGGAVSVTRDSTGWYSVRFAGLARKAGQRDNVQVTAYGAPPGTHCKLMPWVNAGDDLVVPVHCHQPGLDGLAVDTRFTVLVSGARAFRFVDAVCVRHAPAGKPVPSRIRLSPRSTR